MCIFVQFATNLKYMRDERKLSNYRLEMDLWRSQSTVKNWISGDNTTRPKMQKTIADYFVITVDALNCDELPILPPQGIKKERPADGETLVAKKQAMIDEIYSMTDEQCERLFGIIQESKKLL